MKKELYRLSTVPFFCLENKLKKQQFHKEVNFMRTLYFTQITDDRSDKNIKQLLEERIQKLKELLNIEGVELVVSDIEDIHFNGHTEYWKDGTVAYQEPANNQCRCRFQVRKTTRKLTWNDVYKIVNSVKPVPYSFNGFLRSIFSVSHL